MSTQGQGDVVARLRSQAIGVQGHIMLEAADEITRLRSSSRGEQGWRTMDSAPKDGTPILIEAMLSQGLVVVEVRYDAGAQIRGRYGAFVWAPTDGGDIIAEGAARRWMPLPSAPGSVPTSLAGQVPDGYVLVPKEPTDEMYRAALRVTRDPENGHIADHVGGAVYRAMLFAAPQPTAGGDADAK